MSHNTTLPRPPTTAGPLKNPLIPGSNGRRDLSGIRRGSSKNVGDIVIEDQGTATP